MAAGCRWEGAGDPPVGGKEGRAAGESGDTRAKRRSAGKRTNGIVEQASGLSLITPHIISRRLSRDLVCTRGSVCTRASEC